MTLPKQHAKCSEYWELLEYSHLAGALHDLVEDLPQAEQVHETVGAGHCPHFSTTAARHSVFSSPNSSHSSSFSPSSSSYLTQQPVLIQDAIQRRHPICDPGSFQLVTFLSQVCSGPPFHLSSPHSFCGTTHVKQPLNFTQTATLSLKRRTSLPVLRTPLSISLPDTSEWIPDKNFSS